MTTVNCRRSAQILTLNWGIFDRCFVPPNSVAPFDSGTLVYLVIYIHRLYVMPWLFGHWNGVWNCFNVACVSLWTFVVPFVARLSFLLLLKGIYVNARSDKQQTAKQQQENNNRSEYYNGITTDGVHVCLCVCVCICECGGGWNREYWLGPKTLLCSFS